MAFALGYHHAEGMHFRGRDGVVYGEGEDRATVADLSEVDGSRLFLRRSVVSGGHLFLVSSAKNISPHIVQLLFPDSVESITTKSPPGGGNSGGPPALKSVCFCPHSCLQRIGQGTFCGARLEFISLPRGIQKIGRESFSDNPGLEIVSFRPQTSCAICAYLSRRFF